LIPDCVDGWIEERIGVTEPDDKTGDKFWYLTRRAERDDGCDDKEGHPAGEESSDDQAQHPGGATHYSRSTLLRMRAVIIVFYDTSSSRLDRFSDSWQCSN